MLSDMFFVGAVIKGNANLISAKNNFYRLTLDSMSNDGDKNGPTAYVFVLSGFGRS